MGTWEWREMPILNVIGEADARAETIENLGVIVDATGLDRKQAAFGVEALMGDDYIAAIDVGTFGDNAEYLDLRLLPAGREAFGSWPRRDDPLEAFLRVIADREARATDSEQRTKLERVGAALKDLGTQTAAEVLGGVILRGGI